MRHSERGPERRRRGSNADEGESDERREGQDRRRNAFVSELDLCRGLPYDQVEQVLDHCPKKELAADEVLLEPGQANHYLYFLLSGHLDIRLDSISAPTADVIEPGDCIGEMSIIDGQPTSAYVVATEPSTVIAVHDNIFWSRIAVNPVAVRNLARVLAERMRKRNEATLRALEKELRLEQLEKELLAAHEIQNGMLPPGPHLITGRADLDVVARTDVVKAVGGDLYDAIPLDDNTLAIAIGDVSGKGMPAALFMVRVMTLLRAELVKTTKLSDCIERFNKALCDTNISHMFVSLVVLRLCVDEGTLEWVNAGHPPLLLSKKDQPFKEIDDGRSLVAGVLSDAVYETGMTELDAGDRVVLYTDGITEARNPTRHFYGFDRLLSTVNRETARHSTELIDKLFEDVRHFAAGAASADDMTVVALEYFGKE